MFGVRYNLFQLFFLVDGNFIEWGDWGRCSKICGNGIQICVWNCINFLLVYGG